jgi:carboxypeptidase C (cathepsin A)
MKESRVVVGRPAWVLILLLSMLGVASADEETSKGEKKADGAETAAVTKHSGEFGRQKVAYTATAGTIHLRDGEDKVTASVFHVAYTRDGLKTLKDRPLIFAFNGGPGSASLWLHLGALGPKYMAFPNQGLDLPKPPYALENNAHSLLDVADLVFIDPVGTGFSRVEEDGEGMQFHGVNEDIESVADFIRLYVTRHKRWGSPKFLLGESYGAVRGAGLADHLQEEHGMYLNGVMLVSGLLDYSTILPAKNNDLPYVLFLPSMTATAFYHQRLGPDLMEDLTATLRKAETFARSDYAAALFQGNRLAESERMRIGRKLAQFTGLSEAYLKHSNLRVGPFRFMKELMRDQGRTVGRLDSRVLGSDGDAQDDVPEYDPSMTTILGPIASAMNDYLRTDLAYVTDLPYEAMGNVRPWNYPDKNRYTSVMHRLGKAMRKNPHLSVHVSCGYYDMATPYFGILHSLSHLEIPEASRSKITIDFYEGGHMMYTNVEALKQFKADLSAFIAQSK